jgi:hypothetical protein
MATNYPASLDTTTNLPSSPDPFVANTTTGHLSHPPTQNGAIRAIEAKVGIGASTPPAQVGRFLASQEDGSVVWEAPRVWNEDPTSTSYTFALIDLGTAKDFAPATNGTATIPPNSSVAWPRGGVIMVSVLTAVDLTIVAGLGVTIRAAFAAPYILRAQNSVGTLRYRGSNEWLLYGDFR